MLQIWICLSLSLNLSLASADVALHVKSDRNIIGKAFKQSFWIDAGDSDLKKTGEWWWLSNFKIMFKSELFSIILPLSLLWASQMYHILFFEQNDGIVSAASLKHSKAGPPV